MKKQLCAAVLAASLLSGTQAAAWDGGGITISHWAQAEVAAAYESGAVSADFDLGTDYTRPITRAQMARLTVDLVLEERQITLTDLTGELGIALEMAPILSPEDAQQADENAEAAPVPDTPAEEDVAAPDDAGTAPTLPTDTPVRDDAPADTDVPAEDPSTADGAGTDPALPPDTPVRDDAPADADTPAEDTAAPDGAGTDPTLSPDTPVSNDTPADADTSTADDTVTEQPAESPDEPAAGDGISSEAPAEQAPALYGDPLDDGLPYVKTGSFADTRSVYIEAAAQLGIVNGSNGLFRPDDLVTRAEAAAMMQRCMGVFGMTEANRQPMQFTDNYAIPRWAIESVKYISGRTSQSGQAIMGGSGGKFSPQDSYTIEQAILSLGRMQSSLQVTEVYAGWRDAPGYNSVQLALTFGGDCTLGRGHDFAYTGSFDEMYDQKGAAYFFSGISEFFNDDLTMVNFEGTLTTATAHAYKTFVFKGRPEYAKVLEAGSIDVVSLANNHSMDYLQQGFDDTVRYLSPYVAVSAYDLMPIVTVKGVNIGFASNVGWSFDSAQKQFIQNAIQSLRARGADIVVFNYHWGTERSYHSEPTQQAIGRYCIDQGADLVIGHHPHVVQEVETYKGKQIAYSLGNLVFGGNNNPSDKNCLIYRYNVTFDLDTRQVTATSAQALPYRVSSVSWRNDYHPVPR